jgi:hypothetical protein
MRRGKADLAFWRRIHIAGAKGRILRGTREALRKLLRLRDLSALSHSLALGIDATPGAPVDFAFAEPGTVDGLEKLIQLGSRTSQRKGRDSSDFGEDFPRVLRAYLIAASGGVRSVPIKLNASAFISTTNLIRIPQVRAMRTLLQDGPLSVRTIEPLPDTAAVQSAFPQCSMAEPRVRDRTVRMKEYPHIRSGIDLERLDPQEHESFLREAESQKGVPVSKGELLALFRNVPVEIISKVHYVEEKKLLLYTLDNERNPSRTRLHDLGVVRDSAAAKTHLVVHRTQFKSVSMS